MSNAIGIIFANSGSDNLQGLAAERPVAAVPFGGRYRILDFALSSMVNSGIRTIGLVTPHQYRPLLDHLGAGKDWFLERKDGGLFILPGVMHGLAGSNHLFCIKDLENNCEFLEKEYVKNVVISSGDKIYNLNFKETLEFHNEKQADITLLYKTNPYPGCCLKNKLVLRLGEEQRLAAISDFYLPEEDDGEIPEFAGILVIRRELLLEMIQRYSSGGCIDLMAIITMNLGSLKVFAKETNSLIGTICTIKDYFERSMDLLQSSVREQLWLGVDRTHTKIVDNPPTKYAEQAQVRNSLIASGCIIAGEVINSIVFRGVVLEEGCRVQNSILMPQCHIHANAQTNYAILDKSVRVHRDNSLQGSKSHPLVVLKKTVI
ncbi:glucose-1-phosphate adenylyltransferase, GlgD subunit [Desulfosporosinus orientis DSM 765]|uniref:Glucose-1-phosphate adenylyltransferase, GlgD subunit n=1 Tax=Desulfosporosinus orientis (strain ATCC 19365 / DSM 765 / NCIMB 8382 / VKM B-1628 / Singapore I) TaxID=768706 RepID=G7WB94_DESOD|nr:glucose-1-phosphate adenylyltransferase subunit GlgD [Desulfosporosinus orientis]AET67875.1 glucose-1-phosphate adenylyltransferase, GlgD subunit [Desulfosporosinus orientis DSM 765]